MIDSITKTVALVIFLSCYILAITRKIKLAYVGIGSAIALLFVLLPTGGITPEAAFSSINWGVLAIYWGFLMMAITFSKSGVPTKVARSILKKTRNEGIALFILCGLTALISSFMENVGTVILMAPIAIEVAKIARSSPFLHLVSIAISSNMVTTVTMIADPPALILAENIGMKFTDFYLFNGKIGLGAISILGVIAGLAVMALINFRKMRKKILLKEEKVEVTYLPTILFAAGIIALALIPYLGVWNGWVGIGVGILAILAGRKFIGKMFREFDWNSFFFIFGIFIVVGAVNFIGLLRDFAGFLLGLGLNNPVVVLAVITWISVILSSFIDNVPFTMLMIPVCTTIAGSISMSAYPLLYGMVVGTGIGGNVLPIGATANVFACGMLEKMGHKIRLREYLKLSLPSTIVSVGVAHLLLQLLWM
ncbi:MAG: SLC13 family permease [Candidatus Hadarchaeales archaeon]